MPTPPSATLHRVLERSRDLGLLGPGPVEPQIEHALGFAQVVGVEPDAFLDLGAGGGLPGLVLADRWRTARGVLLDAGARRCEFLRWATAELGADERVTVVEGRAEELARTPELRGRFDVVCARSFGPPAVTAECAVGFLAEGGRLVVSEPPEDARPSGPADRWPQDGVRALGLTSMPGDPGPHRFAVLARTGELSARWPRRTGVPRKRPLWG